MPMRTLVRTRKQWLFGLLICCSFALLCVVPGTAFAKSYSMGPVNIDGTVDKNAVLSVKEDRTFSFSGNYHYVYWEFDTTKGEQYSDFAMSEIKGGKATPYGPAAESIVTSDPSQGTAGTFAVDTSGSSVKVYAFFNKDDTDATFRLTYKVTGGVKRYQDTSEIYWQLIGSGWGESTKDISAKVTLPVPQGETVTPGQNVKAWAHGPLNGTIKVNDDGTITLSVPRVDPGTFVEVRAIFPQEWLAGATTIQTDQRDSILKEEADLANKANAERSKARMITNAFNVGVPVVGLIVLLFAIFAFFRWGKEYAPTFQDHYLREVPDDLHPAVAGALWRWGSVGDKEFTATLMNLSVMGVVDIKEKKTETKGVFGSTKTEEDYLLTLDRAKADTLTDPIDKEAVSLIFSVVGKGAEEVSFDAIKAYGKANPQSFVTKMNNWKDEVKAVPAEKGYFEMSGNAAMVGVIVLGVLVLVAGIVGMVMTGSVIPIIAGIGCAIPTIILGSQMRRRSREGNELEAKYRALYNYLKDFSKLDEAPPMHVILWQKFLVMAIVFGIADQVIEAMKVKVPEIVNDPGFLPVYIWLMPHGNMGAPATAFAGTFVSAQQAASSAMASAGGGGGGFSVGGGGGFGGGGGGAG